MGLSKVVGINSVLLLGLAFTLRNTLPPYVLFPLLHAAVVGIIVAIASHPVVNLSLLFCKTTDGSFPWWSQILFYSYLLSARVYIFVRRKTTVEPLYSKVCEGLYVGGWPFLPDDVPPGEPAVVDCTCELPRSAFAAELPYLCIPTWDSRGPRPEDIELAVRWASGKRSQNRPVFIHCAFGHGRSVAVMCALLVSLCLAETWKDGEKMVKNARPFIRLNHLQRKSLEKWNRQRKG